MASTALVPTSTQAKSRESTYTLIEWIKSRRGVEQADILAAFLASWESEGYRPVRAALDRGLIETSDVHALITEQQQAIHLDIGDIDPLAAVLLGVERSERLQALCKGWDPETDDLIVVTAREPTSVARSEVEDVLSPTRVSWKIASQSALASCIDSLGILLSGGQDDDDDTLNLGEKRSEALKSYEQLVGDLASPISRAMQKAIAQAIGKNASDIHVETVTRRGRVSVDVRFRINGEMTHHASYVLTVGAGMINRFRIASKMSMDATKPDDGHVEIALPGSEAHFDLRVHYDPLHVGAAVVVRVLAQNRDALEDLPSIFPVSESPLLKQLRSLIHRPDGILLVAGRTGDGKSTTMAAILSEVCQPNKKVVTAEQPVEYHIPGAQQVQVAEDKEDGHSFAAALRGFMRADPDVIMVGEVRDESTAEMAVRAAQTGHAVISTIHVRDAAAAPQRLLELGGASPSALADTLIGVLAQRLIRVVCPCVIPSAKGAAVVVPENYPGCGSCNGGWAGRKAVAELLIVTPSVREAIVRGADPQRIRGVGQMRGFVDHLRVLLQKCQTTRGEVEDKFGPILDGGSSEGDGSSASLREGGAEMDELTDVEPSSASPDMVPPSPPPLPPAMVPPSPLLPPAPAVEAMGGIRDVGDGISAGVVAHNATREAS